MSPLSNCLTVLLAITVPHAIQSRPKDNNIGFDHTVTGCTPRAEICWALLGNNGQKFGGAMTGQKISPGGDGKCSDPDAVKAMQAVLQKGGIDPWNDDVRVFFGSLFVDTIQGNFRYCYENCRKINGCGAAGVCAGKQNTDTGETDLSDKGCAVTMQNDVIMNLAQYAESLGVTDLSLCFGERPTTTVLTTTKTTADDNNDNGDDDGDDNDDGRGIASGSTAATLTAVVVVMLMGVTRF